MNIFLYILQKQMGAQTTILPTDLYKYWNHIFSSEKMGSLKKQLTETQRTSHIALYYYIQHVYREANAIEANDSYVYFDTLAQTKFGNMRSITENLFLNKNIDYILDIFRKTQTVYWKFSRLAQQFRLRRAKLQITNDLYLNPIEEKMRSMIIFQAGAKYQFKISDLCNIVNTALTNSSFFFAEPLYPKNPYTNLEFSRGILIELYLQLRASNFKFPTLLHAFMLCEFELDDFVLENEALIREIHIENYVKKSTTDTLYDEVILMIQILDRKRILCIDPEFPKAKLVDIMRPYLHLYLINEYSLIHSSKNNTVFEELKRKFKRFIAHNPLFGRKKFIAEPTFSGNHYTSCFREDHLAFYENH